MWVLTRAGFFSAVENPRDKHEVMVRARVKNDLDVLRTRFCPQLSATITTPVNDYRFRAFVSKELWGQALEAMGRDIDYDNFKDMVDREQGHERHDVYSGVWGVLSRLQEGGPYGMWHQKVDQPGSPSWDPASWDPDMDRVLPNDDGQCQNCGEWYGPNEIDPTHGWCVSCTLDADSGLSRCVACGDYGTSEDIDPETGICSCCAFAITVEGKGDNS